ncbi:unnamed protein product [Adineta ricciae]|uniref:G-protein coupled receptors family 1 profile domain-containing protein n=1 Tax=Adineta ricciae TaxID=249248 RepID=A0A814MBA9_ADIRI|nr:unnamed protein product [Adineta ricciae]CAF1181977.1 unnamed protein product [Adineta ricciae]
MLPSVAFTLVTMISSGLALLITFMMLIMMFVYLRSNRDIAFLLMINTYIAMFVFSFLVFYVNIYVFKSDLYGFSDLDTSHLNTCLLQGFLIYVAFACCYMSFVLQAFYRFTRVVYPKQRIFQSFLFYIVCILLQWIMCSTLLLPPYLWPTPIYGLYKNDYYCGMLYRYIGALTYSGAVMYISPVIFLTLIYARLMLFIRHQTSNSLHIQQMRRAQRDFTVIRRIIFIVNTLTLPGIPNCTFTLMTSIDPSISGFYYMYRIQWLLPAVGVFIFSIALVIITPQLKSCFLDTMHYNHNQVLPVEPGTTNQLGQSRF